LRKEYTNYAKLNMDSIFFKPGKQPKGRKVGPGIGKFPVKAMGPRTGECADRLAQTDYGVSCPRAANNFKETHHENQ